METQKIVNLVNSPKNEYSKFATKKWYVIDSESKGGYLHEDPIKFLIKSIESSLCDYSDAYILVTGNITVTRAIAVLAGSPAGTQPQRKQPLATATQVAFKNIASFKDCRANQWDLLIMQILLILQCLCTIWSSIVTTILILMEVYWILTNNANVTIDDNASSFKYKANLITNTEADGTKKGIEIAVPRKYLSNFGDH